MAHKIIFALSLLLLSLANLSLGEDNLEIGVYWGQNKGEGSLRDACDTDNYDIVSIAFLTTFGHDMTPVLNLTGHCRPDLGGCTYLGEEIRQCKRKGIKVFLSIGGPHGNYYLSSEEDAKNVAQYLWDNYLGGQSDSRPLGDESLDGIDFSIEGGRSNKFYDVLASAIQEFGQDSRQKVYLAASPGCQYPDYYLQEAINTGIFNYLWVRFYNSPPCQYKDDHAKDLLRSWRKNWSKIPAEKVYLGLAASPEAAQSGFIPVDKLNTEVLPNIMTTPKFGGVMLWNRYYDRGYSQAINPQNVDDEDFTTPHLSSII